MESKKEMSKNRFVHPLKDGHSDLIYGSAATRPFDGLPVGNGSTGGLFWHTTRSLLSQINHTDLWDDQPDAKSLPVPWHDRHPKYEEKVTMLAHACELEIDSGLPVYDWRYNDNYEARILLYEGELRIRSKGYFGEVHCSIFGSRETQLMIIDYSDRLTDASRRKIIFERISSRMFLSGVLQDTSSHMSDVRCFIKDGVMVIEQQLRKINFAVAMAVEGTAGKSTVEHTRGASFATAKTKEANLRIFLSVAHSEECENLSNEAITRVKNAAKIGIKKLRGKNQNCWAKIWERCYLSISDLYWEKLWYLNLYQLSSSCSGRYHPHFIGSLWGTEKEVKRWNDLYHWNGQITLWPLYGAGQPELTLPWHKLHIEVRLPQAKIDADKVHKAQGAYFTDVYLRNGLQATGWTFEYFLCPGLMIGLSAYRHYIFTKDDEFLKNNAYQIIKEVLKFYSCVMKKDSQGIYNLPAASIYEMGIAETNKAKNPLSDLPHLEMLLEAFFEILGKVDEPDKDFVETMRDMRGHIYQPAIIDMPKQFYEILADGTKVYKDGHMKGNPIESDSIYALGFRVDTGKPFTMVDSHAFTTGQYLFGGVASMPVYPSKAMGMGTPEGIKKIIEATINSAYDEGTPRTLGAGHYPTPIAMARLGDTEHFKLIMNMWVDEFQHFRNGLWNYMPRFQLSEHSTWYQQPEPEVYEEKDAITQSGERVGKVLIPKDVYLHVGLEAGCIFQTALQEALVTDHKGITYLFVAMPEEINAKFKLWNERGVSITASRVSGKVEYVVLETPRQETIKLKNPFAKTRIQQGQSIESFCEEDFIELKLESGGKYILTDASKRMCINLLEASVKHIEQNREFMKRDRAFLGRPKISHP